MPDIRLSIVTDAGGAITGIRQVGDGLEGLSGKATKSTAALKDMSSGLTSLIAPYLAWGAAIKLASDSLTAQAAQEDAINKLNLALANQGALTSATSKSLIDYSAALQSTSTYADEVILAGEALLVSFGQNEEQVKRTTKAALDFAAATGKDLTTAFELLGKASVGETGTLSRYGIVVDETLSKSEKFGAALSQIENRFSGSAQAATQTFSGQMAQLKNSFGDAEEQLGKFLGALVDGAGAFGVLGSAIARIGDFFGKDLPISLGYARGAVLDLMATFIQFHADAISKFAGTKIGDALGFVSGVDVSKVAADANEFAAALRLQAIEARASGLALAASSGQTLKFSNAQVSAHAPVEKVTDAMKKQAVAALELANAYEESYKAASKIQGQALFDKSNALTGLGAVPGVNMLDTIKGGINGDNGLIAAMEAWQAKYGAINDAEAKRHAAAVKNLQQESSLIGSAFGKLPGVILAAIQGGGNVLKAIGASLGGGELTQTLGTKLGTTITNTFGGSIGKALGSFVSTSIPIVGSLVGSLFGGLFGGGAKKKAEEEQRKKQAEEDAIQSLAGLQKRWEQFRSTTIAGGVTGLAAMFNSLSSATDQSDERLQRLGSIGFAVFESLRKSGMSVVDAMRAMGPALDAAIKKAAGRDMGEAFGSLVNFRGLVTDNEALVNGVEGLNQVLSALRVTGNLTQQTFTDLQLEATGFFDSLIAQGFNSQQALALLAPTLLSIREQAANGQLAIDDATQSMIDQADKAGLFEGLKDPMAEMVEIQKLMLETTAALAQVFGADLPASVRAYIDALKSIPTNVPGPPGGVPLPSGSTPVDNYPGFAGGTGGVRDFGGGTPVVLHGREAVVTEQQLKSGSGTAVLGELRGLRADMRMLPRLVRDAVQLGAA